MRRPAGGSGLSRSRTPDFLVEIAFVGQTMRRTTRTITAKTTLLWIAGTVLLAILVPSVNALAGGRRFSWLRYLEIARQGRQVHATVVRTEPESHCAIAYVFTASEREYRGAGSLCGSKVGDRVAISYWETDPTYSCLGNAHQRLWNELALLSALPFLLSLVAAFGLWRRDERRAAADCGTKG
jgi:hypothetical protein